ncbi:hypothetical protein N6H18_04980 [Reichenbachiella agarivorans]|uniref:Bacteroides conjugative transposon TraN protein n=1 Tax=Reichenbachiella agarivorans TaxID=2979464 RepID=A0ABY6CS46_9BACT|nr:hypothetical protein [Reichenbachiella agarivorans]UXP33303.1 hypothetical protein N6H18_04980 [Reichenbachiella agarivorans]
MLKTNWLRLILGMALLVVGDQLCAQDTLTLHSGRKIPFMRMLEFRDVVRVKDYEEGEMVDILPDSIMGYTQSLSESSYYLIFYFNEEGEREYLFVERYESGAIALFVDQRRGYSMFMQKEGLVKEVYDMHDNRRARDLRFLDFSLMLADDDTTFSYVNSSDFRFKPGDIRQAVQNYNLRNFEQSLSAEEPVRSTVYLYRTPYQKTKDRIRIELNGATHLLYINDFIQLDLPIEYPSRLTLYDKETRSDILIAGELKDQYYEVLYDSQSKAFRLDPKSGTELHFEFNGIKERVMDKFGRD